MILSSGTIPTAIPTRSKPRTTYLRRRDLTGGNRNSGLFGADCEPDRDRAQDIGIGFLDRDVIDHRNRSRSDTDCVVDIHRDAIDADRVVTVHHLRDDRLRADPVRTDREADPADVDDIGKVTYVQFDGPESARRRPGLLYIGDDLLKTGFRRVDVDPGRLMGAFVGLQALIQWRRCMPD